MESSHEELLREYYFIQERISQFDERQLNIKSWGTTASSALIGLAITQSKADLFLVGAAASLLFWFIDAQWKTFQITAIDHSRQLEILLHSKSKQYIGPTISEHYRLSLRGWAYPRRVLTSMYIDNVCLPYLPIFGFSLVLYCLGWGS